MFLFKQYLKLKKIHMDNKIILYNISTTFLLPKLMYYISHFT